MNESLLEWRTEGLNVRMHWSDGEAATGDMSLAIVTLGRSRKKLDEDNIEHRVS